jgi:uncharacterized protein GlcG (DUF336 family)
MPRTDRIRPMATHIRSLGLALAMCAYLVACGGGGGGGSAPGDSPSPAVPLTAAEVRMLVQAAAQSADSSTMVIAVVDRPGNILAVYKGPSAPAMAPGNFGKMVATDELAVSLARTGAFFSNDQAPLSSRTVRFISGIHFPPGISFTPNAALYGIENTNRGCTLATKYLPNQAVPPSRSIDGSTTGLGITTGKADVNDSDPGAVNPGGVPIFKGGRHVVGGIGVAGVAPDVAEFAAFTAENINVDGVALPLPLPPPGEVVIDGISLPFVNQTTPPSGVGAGTFDAANFEMGHAPSDGALPAEGPEGDLVMPTDGMGGLKAANVTTIINNAIGTAMVTRAAIRLPLGSRTRMVIAISDLNGMIIGLNRMSDATIFSIDVAATKARNVIYFSGMTRTTQDLNQVPMGTAVTNRTISFGAQPLFPPGIDGSGAGPFFNLYTMDVANPCTQGFQTPPSPPNQSGIVFFPGSEPLYINGVLVGGLGVSGDGVEQDDFVTDGGACGTAGACDAGCPPNTSGVSCFVAPPGIRADQVFINTPGGPVRLPYTKFPRNPTQ